MAVCVRQSHGPSPSFASLHVTKHRRTTSPTRRRPGPNYIFLQASYPLTFSPVRATEQEFVSKLLLADLKDKNKPAKFEFDLRGTAEEPLAEGHRVVRCSARERVEQVFRLKNVTGKGETRKRLLAACCPSPSHARDLPTCLQRRRGHAGRGGGILTNT